MLACGSTSTIIDTAEERFGKGTAPQAIILTHGHFDHVGIPGALTTGMCQSTRTGSNSPDRSGRLPRRPSVGKGVLVLMSLAYPNKATDLGSRVQTLPEDESVPHMLGAGFTPRSYPWACLAIPREIAA